MTADKNGGKLDNLIKSQIFEIMQLFVGVEVFSKQKHVSFGNLRLYSPNLEFP